MVVEKHLYMIVHYLLIVLITLPLFQQKVNLKNLKQDGVWLGFIPT